MKKQSGCIIVIAYLVLVLPVSGLILGILMFPLLHDSASFDTPGAGFYIMLLMMVSLFAGILVTFPLAFALAYLLNMRTKNA